MLAFSFDDIIMRGVDALMGIIKDYLMLLLVLAGIFLVIGLFGVFGSKPCSRDYRNLAIGIILLLLVIYIADYTGAHLLFVPRNIGQDPGYY